MNKFTKFIVNSNYRFMVMASLGLLKYMPDKPYIEKLYRIRVGKSLNLSNPQSFNEKLQWLKLYYRKDQFSLMVDKYESKQLLLKLIDAKYIVPTIGVYNSFSEIDFSQLPQAFVIKTTHDSGTVVICKNKDTFDYKGCEEKINKSLKTNYYYHLREWPYKNVKPRIIIEEYLDALDGSEMVEYKLFTFNGVTKMILVCKGTAHSIDGGRTNDWMDENFNRLPFKSLNPISKDVPKKPECLGELIELAKKISDGLPHLRVDFYVVNNRVYVGELTFYHNSGMCSFEPDEWDYKIGEWLQLP